MFEDPYKSVCQCRLQSSILGVRVMQNGEVSFLPCPLFFTFVMDKYFKCELMGVLSQGVGPEEQFDLGEWRLLPREDKLDRFSLTREKIQSKPDLKTVITFKVSFPHTKVLGPFIHFRI